MKLSLNVKTKAVFVSCSLLLIFLTGCGRQSRSNIILSNRMSVEESERPNEASMDMATSEEMAALEESVEGDVTKSIAKEPPTEQEEVALIEEPDISYDFTVCFAGDINLSDDWCTTQIMDWSENGIYDCISPELMTVMQEADIMCLNNEFPYSEAGTQLPGKRFHFRANPKRVEVIKQMGVDIVSLANNHAYDYGKQAFLDTLTTLEEAEVSYVGAGKTLAEAMQPKYLTVDGKTVAFVAASRAEKNRKTPQATETEPGILLCYDPELFLQVIEEARTHADFVIAYVHWGTEYSTVLEPEQLATGKDYLDAGADIVIGAHSHCLQGIEYYENKPIIYSLGNYWFNEKTLDTMLLRLHFYGDAENQVLDVQVIPAVQSGYHTDYASDDAEQNRIYRYLEGISMNVEITEDGYVVPKKE